MSIIYILIPIAVLFTALGIYLFFWAVKSEQFEDLEKQGLSILFDDDDIIAHQHNSSKTVQKNDNKEQQAKDENRL
ncbi:MAG: cbb3-type cytochrome oxidase assembly protein CcoS [Gammaproteobacteria bacterium]|nr:MAG: cbb3-type cytochrome oxidase assembly protein CcoS [Gammaproteobacteria bacterium]